MTRSSAASVKRRIHRLGTNQHINATSARTCQTFTGLNYRTTITASKKFREGKQVGEPMDGDARVALAEIKGDVKLVLAGQSRTNDDVKDLRERVHVHGNRLQVIEAKEHQRSGAIGAAKFLWGIGGFSLMGALAIVARHFAL